MNRVIIVGAGISGLSAAYYLNKAGIRATVIESADRLGGIIQTEHKHGCIIEGGPDSFMAAKPWLMELIREVGLGGEVINSNDHLRKTYILRGGKLIPMPDGLMMMIPTKIMPLVTTPLLSWGCKIRMGLEMLRRPGKPRPDRSVHEFIVDHYGEEALDYLTEPLLAGVYGGDPREMSINSVLGRFVELETKYGSLSRGTLAAPKPKGAGSGGSLFRTLKDGLGSLVEKLVPAADIVHGRAEALKRQGEGYSLRVGGQWMTAEQVIFATPAYNAADLIRPLDSRLADLLSKIPYNDSTTITLGYRKSEFHHPIPGFGFLVPKKERRYVAACTWINNKFNGRAADDVVLLRCFLGREGLQESDGAVLDATRRELDRIMGLKDTPFFHSISRWPASMAQFTVGHADRLTELEQRRAQFPGLFLIGNGYRGVGLPDCVKMGKETAQTIAGVPAAKPVYAA